MRWHIIYKKSRKKLSKSEVQIINPEGQRGNVFAVYRPGISSFQGDVTYAFINGLKDSDWKIDVTIPSSETTSDLSKYDLLILGTPTRGGMPHKSVSEYLKRVGDLNGMKTVLIVTAGGGKGALIALEKEVKARNGKIIDLFCFIKLGYKGDNPTDICYKAAVNL
jgi:flavorubredoxin